MRFCSKVLSLRSLAPVENVSDTSLVIGYVRHRCYGYQVAILRSGFQGDDRASFVSAVTAWAFMCAM